ncbi:MAG: IPT/TIG domain-containing protein, partial [Solirubrobacteraceae bacterium]
TDTTTHLSIGRCTGSNPAATEVYPVGSAVNAGDQLSIQLDGCTNPGVSTGDTLTVSTGSDTTAVNSPTYVVGGAPPPSVSAVNPRSAPPGGGTSVTITGASFTGATNVSFGSTAATGFTVVSDTQIAATSPAGSGTVDVTVTTPASRSLLIAADQFTYAVSASAPMAITGAPQSVTATSALVSGTVNPDGSATTAHFEYGLDPKYSGGGPIVYDQVTPDVTVGAGTTAQPVSATLSNLIPNALYHVRPVATNPAGTSTGLDQTFQTAIGAPPPPPVLGQTQNVAPVTGLVLVKLPGSAATGGGLRDLLGKGQGFIPLTEARQLPVGSQVDARAGTLMVSAAPAAAHGKLQVATLGGAIFGISQSRTGLSKGLTTFGLLEGDFPGAPSYASCPGGAGDLPNAGAAALHPTNHMALQTLHANDNHGSFRTTGRYSAGTVRGTVWTTSDRCDGTLTVVKRGTVDVFDNVTRRTVTVHAGHSFLAQRFPTAAPVRG